MIVDRLGRWMVVIELGVSQVLTADSVLSRNAARCACTIPANTRSQPSGPKRRELDSLLDPR